MGEALQQTFHQEKMLKIFVIREAKIEATMRYHFTPTDVTV